MQKLLLVHAENADHLDLSERAPIEPQPSVNESEDPSVAVIPVEGILGKRLDWFEASCGGCDCNDVAAALDLAAKSPAVQSVILDFNSPGGTVTGIPELGRKIAAFDKPIFAFTEVECCSAAYWLASQTDAIFATPSSVLGSVGVYLALLDESGWLEKEGLKVNAIVAGKYKLMGAPFKPLTDDERKMLQRDVNKIFDQFKAAITAQRTLDEEFLQGQVFDGDDALKIGMVDATVEAFSEVLALAKRVDSMAS